MGNTSSAFGAVAASRFEAMRASHTTAEKKAEGNNDTSIEVPAAIKNLNTGSDYWVKAKNNRYKMLIREGHLKDLLELAALALTKDKPANWFANVASKKRWERTLDFLKKRHAVLKRAEQVAARIGKDISKRMKDFVCKQIWMGKSVERWAVAAEELPHDKPNQSRAKLFAWLCKQEGQGTAVQNPA